MKCIVNKSKRETMTTLVLYASDPVIVRRLRQRAAQYNHEDSGFDLEVTAEPTGNVQIWEQEVLLTTGVRAKVIGDEEAAAASIPCYAFHLQLRSSVPMRTGWFLGNGVGLIDRGYCDELKAYLMTSRTDLTMEGKTKTPWPSLLDTRVVQIVAHDLQPFRDIIVLDNPEAWLRLIARTAAPDRGGGLGSTG